MSIKSDDRHKLKIFFDVKRQKWTVTGALKDYKIKPSSHVRFEYAMERAHALLINAAAGKDFSFDYQDYPTGEDLKALRKRRWPDFLNEAQAIELAPVVMSKQELLKKILPENREIPDVPIKQSKPVPVKEKVELSKVESNPSPDKDKLMMVLCSNCPRKFYTERSKRPPHICSYCMNEKSKSKASTDTDSKPNKDIYKKYQQEGYDKYKKPGRPY